MYYCSTCGNVFEEPLEVNTTYESFYGVSNLFSNSTPLTMHVCPYCKETGYEEMEECPMCGEYCKHDDMIDTEGLYNGGIDLVCPNCIRDLD